MNPTTKRICLYMAIFLLLEIGLLIGWNMLRSREAVLTQNPVQTRPETAEIPATEAPMLFTQPSTEALFVETVPLETEAAQTVPPETTVPETVPESTAEAEALTEAPAETETVAEETAVAETQTVENTAPEETQPEPEQTQTQESALPEPVEEPEYVQLQDGSIPCFYQNDYAHARYETSNIAKSGSGITALAMVASYMTDHVYYPDELADYVAHFLGNHYERLEFGSDLLQLSWKRARNIHEVLESVKNGKVAIILVNSKSIFTSGQHYLVLTGATEDGLITVLDPDKEHYSKPGIDGYLRDGVKENYLFGGFEAGWVYDKSAMPEETFLYTPEPFAEECRYSDLSLSDSDLTLIAKIIWLEGRGEPFEGQQAIAEVILNRMASGKFGSTISNIIHAPGQFPSVEKLHRAKPTYSQYKAVERAMYGPYIVPEDVVFYAKFAVNDKIWGKIGAHVFCHSKY